MLALTLTSAQNSFSRLGPEVQKPPYLLQGQEIGFDLGSALISKARATLITQASSGTLITSGNLGLRDFPLQDFFLIVDTGRIGPCLLMDSPSSP